MFERLRVNILKLLYPSKCTFCGNSGEIVCKICFTKIPKTVQEKNEVISIFSYKNEKVWKMLWLLKYRHAGVVAEYFGSVMAEMLAEKMLRIFSAREILNSRIFLIPVPLNLGDKRLNNHAEILANAVQINLHESWGGSSALSAAAPKTLPHLLQKNSPKQQNKTESRSERFQNIKNSISLKNTFPFHPNDILILIDDVSTTGATLSEAKNLLLRKFPISPKNILSICVAN